MTLGEWRGDAALFAGFFNTAPAEEIHGVPWAMLLANLAPSDGPAIVAEKADCVYFLPCLLKDAPLVGKTRERAEERGTSLVGKMRSAMHITEARLIVADLDGITEAQLADIESRMQAEGLTYLLYSTHSHGRADKPGIRCRVLLPVDTPLNSTDYALACAGANVLLFAGLADPACFKLCQQNGAYTTAADRAALAFRRDHRAGVCSVAALLAAAPKPQAKPSVPVRLAEASPFTERRVRAALAQLDPNPWGTWNKAGLMLKAAYSDAAFDAWAAWSATADEGTRLTRDEYAAEWDKLKPYAQSGPAEGALMAMARGAALQTARAHAATGVWDAAGKAALVYLRAHYPRTFHAAFTTGKEAAACNL